MGWTAGLVAAALVVAMPTRLQANNNTGARFQYFASARFLDMLPTAAHGSLECREVCRVTTGCVAAVITTASPHNCSIVQGTKQLSIYDPRYEAWELFYGLGSCRLRRGLMANDAVCDPSATPMDYSAMDANPVAAPAEAFSGLGVRVTNLKDGDVVCSDMMRVDYQVSLPRTRHAHQRAAGHHALVCSAALRRVWTTDRDLWKCCISATRRTRIARAGLGVAWWCRAADTKRGPIDLTKRFRVLIELNGRVLVPCSLCHSPNVDRIVRIASRCSHLSVEPIDALCMRSVLCGACRGAAACRVGWVLWRTAVVRKTRPEMPFPLRSWQRATLASTSSAFSTSARSRRAGSLRGSPLPRRNSCHRMPPDTTGYHRANPAAGTPSTRGSGRGMPRYPAAGTAF